jgi:AbrB family looped-hinge helix DNA binding protein
VRRVSAPIRRARGARRRGGVADGGPDETAGSLHASPARTCPRLTLASASRTREVTRDRLGDPGATRTQRVEPFALARKWRPGNERRSNRASRGRQLRAPARVRYCRSAACTIHVTSVLSPLVLHDNPVSMRTRVTDRGQVSIPAAIRRKLGIRANTAVEWVLDGNAVRVIPIPEDPVGALRGAGKPGAVQRLLEDRRRDRRRDG